MKERSQFKDGIPSIVDRRARSRRVHGHADDINMLGHVKEETVILGSGNDQSRADSEGSWRQFKAQWEASWEDAYSGQGQEHLSRKVALKDRRERSSTPRDTSDDDLLRTARIISAGPAFAVGASTLKVRKQPRSRKPAFNRESSSSSSSPRPATSPSLPASSSLPSTMPSSLSLSESFFISADEVPETPSLPLVPLVMAFPFPSSTVSLLPPPSRDPSRARSRGATPGSVSPYPSETSTPFIFDLHAGRFDPLHLPSFIALSFSILRPLRAHMWSATHRLLTAPFRVASTAGDDEKDVRKVDEQMEDHKLAFSFDSIDTEEYNPEPSSSSSAYRFRRALWPTGVMLVGGFLLGFAVGYLRVF
ncbi:hypothetical protein BT96DRAFT_387372 [Gymnopus androsaceus JB14]|uniref:Uncharacterized protein n=1 Tax=Gymnopus androsaceus JB14 TaxID=1447944 RepID=A0A6A4I534_9AGAR|nr:hypothetical protein BT96DRAFT_387372 [Gymnopus androsaceus JB14]